MTDHESERQPELPESLRAQLVAAFGADSPDPHLQRRTIAALRAEGLVSDAGSATPGARSRFASVAAIAAGLLLFAAGFWAGGVESVTPAANGGEETGDLYLMLLHEPPGGLVAEGATEADLVAEYGAWAGELAAAGHLVRGEKLAAMRVDVGSLAATAAAASPTMLSGFFLLRAVDLEQASAMAQSCPHVKYGGGVELRPIDPT